ncbi:hypothetical protein SLA2020_335290 [Shorea laevis]
MSVQAYNSTVMDWRWSVQSFVLDSTQMLCSAKEEESEQHSTLKKCGKVDIHPASVNAGVHLFPLPYMVYSEKVKTTGIYIRDSTK